MEVDPVADKILQHCHFQQDHKAIKSTEDGDCLFNSVSTLLVRDESLPTELRYKTCKEMFINIIALHAMLVHFVNNSFCKYV